jgi:hypothetical protein
MRHKLGLHICKLVVPSDVFKFLLVQVALVASQTPCKAQAMAEQANMAGQANFGPQPLEPDGMRHMLIMLRSLFAEDRVHIIHSIMQETFNEIPRLSCAYVLWQLNTIWPEPRSILHRASPMNQFCTCS